MKDYKPKQQAEFNDTVLIVVVIIAAALFVHQFTQWWYMFD
jgi:hypothetical protein